MSDLDRHHCTSMGATRARRPRASARTRGVVTRTCGAASSQGGRCCGCGCMASQLNLLRRSSQGDLCATQHDGRRGGRLSNALTAEAYACRASLDFLSSGRWRHGISMPGLSPSPTDAMPTEPDLRALAASSLSVVCLGRGSRGPRAKSIGRLAPLCAAVLCAISGRPLKSEQRKRAAAPRQPSRRGFMLDEMAPRRQPEALLPRGQHRASTHRGPRQHVVVGPIHRGSKRLLC